VEGINGNANKISLKEYHLAHHGYTNSGDCDLRLYAGMDSDWAHYGHTSWGFSRCILFPREVMAQGEKDKKPDGPVNSQDADLRDVLRECNPRYDNLLRHRQLEANDGDHLDLHRNKARLLYLQRIRLGPDKAWEEGDSHSGCYHLLWPELRGLLEYERDPARAIRGGRRSPDGYQHVLQTHPFRLAS